MVRKLKFIAVFSAFSQSQFANSMATERGIWLSLSKANIQDWKSQDVTPDLSKAMIRETLAAARDTLLFTFGILNAMMAPATTGPLIREGQRHLASWGLSPIARMIGQEASEKLGQPVTLDVMQPLQAYDAGGRARALSGIVKALSEAKAADLSEQQTTEALALVGWGK